MKKSVAEMFRLAAAVILISAMVGCGGGVRGTGTESEEALGHFQEGEELLENGQLGASIAAFTRAIRADPDFIDAYNKRGDVSMVIRRWPDAVSNFDEVLRLDSDNVQAYYNRAFAYSQMERPEAAVSDYTEVVNRESGYAEAFSNRGSQYIRMGLPALALEDFDSAIEINGELSRAYVGMAIAYSMLEMPEEAQTAIDDSVERGYIEYNVKRMIERALAEYQVVEDFQ